VLALTTLVKDREGPRAARAYLAAQLKDRPSVRGQAALMDLSLADATDDARQTLRELHQSSEQLLVRTPGYRCNHCGFGARSHHWLCPSCREWGTIKPVMNDVAV